MWQNYAQQEDLQRSGGKLTLPALSDSTRLCRPQLQSNRVQKLKDEFVCTLGNNISQIPSAIRSTMGHLTSRHMEASQWQAHVSQSVSQVDREIGAVEQVKDVAEGCLQERQLYSQLMSDCVAVDSTLSSAGLRPDQVMAELKKEEQLTKESKELLQNQIAALRGKLSSLKEIRVQLQADFQDKGKAVKLITRCITWEVNTPCSQLPAAHYKLNHVSYDKWLSHSKNLKQMADKLVMDSTAFRGILHFSMANIKNSQEHQRRRTEDALKRKVHKLNRVNETLTWEKQWVKEEISDLTKDGQKLTGQISNCESKLHLATHRLDILNQRSRYELCLDHPHISLTLERQDLAKIVAGLHSVLNRSHQELQLAYRRLAIVEDKLVKNSHSLEVTQSCQNLHRSFLPALDRAVVLTNKPRLRPVTSSFSTQTYLQ
ncbi:uncharacterized protein LOC108238987 [Kryptolebias marmoratus]|uniref:uncharacterized protein LOC108238987 n=1 Tax=Kryptolebias marmoratus TaxID=37003 RepID=UPI000D530529|nr:uncharacterized protein LOC108238987 [Kryptolebias marmoratus]